MALVLELLVPFLVFLPLQGPTSQLECFHSWVAILSLGGTLESCCLSLPSWGNHDTTGTLKAILDALHSGRDPTHIMPNTPFDRALDLWKDHEKLGQAHVSLAAKSKDPCIDIFLWTRLTGMLGVLNLYLDPVLHHTWTEASLIVARIQGSGEKRARNLCQWILEFVQVRELPSHRYGTACWSLLEHEDIKEAIQLQLWECTKGRHITAADVMIPLMPSQQMDEESAMTLWKKNIASWRTTDRRRGAHPVRPRAANGELVDTKAHIRRITARIDAEAEDAEEQLSIARLVSAEGSTWDYSCRAGVVTSRSTVTQGGLDRRIIPVRPEQSRVIQEPRE